MELVDNRVLVAQLADDLAWLEGHCRRQPELAAEAGRVRLAAALVRNCVGPYLDGQTSEPLHLVVVGGAGTGKSTVVNFLSGSNAAEANPQAGFTRHPIAYTSAQGPLNWPARPGFLGPLQRLAQPGPSNVDQDVYQVRRVGPPPNGLKMLPADSDATGDKNGTSPADAHNPLDLLSCCVVWDCPDMTTWAAEHYVARLLEVSGLADVIVFVASDERYNDEVPTQFLKMLVKAGKAVVVVLTKMRPEQAGPLLDHFRSDVLGSLGGGRNAVRNTACLAIPQLSPEELADPVGRAGRYRIPLLNQVLVLTDPPAEARARSARAAVDYLKNDAEGLLAVARRDLDALDAWRAVVQRGQDEFIDRYRREYLSAARFRQFDEALVRLLDLLELPGPAGRLLSAALWVVRTPYRLAREAVRRALARPDGVELPERDVLEASYRGWMDALRAEALRRADTHPMWRHMLTDFESGKLGQEGRDVYDVNLRNFSQSLAGEVEKTSQSIYAELEKNPAQLNALRGMKFTLDAAAVGGVVVMGGLNALDLVLVPLAASVSHQLVEWFGQSYIDRQRENLRARQESLATQLLSGPVAGWLARRPATGGSAYERLQRTLSRIPQDVRRLDEAVTRRAAHGH